MMGGMGCGGMGMMCPMMGGCGMGMMCPNMGMGGMMLGMMPGMDMMYPGMGCSMGGGFYPGMMGCYRIPSNVFDTHSQEMFQSDYSF
ncbi:hypothetical protein Aduo_006983 [Ancylostoma duodenale]